MGVSSWRKLKRRQEETKEDYSFFRSFIYSLPTQQDCELPVILSFRKSRHKLIWKILSNMVLPRFGGENGGVLSMHMQVFLDSSFARPGSAPLWGGKKGEFRDWTRLFRTAWCSFTTCLSSRGKLIVVFVCHRTVSMAAVYQLKIKYD